MRSLLVALALLFGAGIAHAGTFSPLQIPTVVAQPYPVRHLCAGFSFNATDGVVGECRTLVYGPTGGRGSTPVQYYTFYSVQWDNSGNVVSAVPCGTLRFHLPQADVWAYAAGYDATNCRQFQMGTSSTVTITWNGPWGPGDYSYYYVATSPDGLYELLNDQNFSYVYQF
jgi:hypothetical protein